MLIRKSHTLSMTTLEAEFLISDEPHTRHTFVTILDEARGQAEKDGAPYSLTLIITPSSFRNHFSSTTEKSERDASQSV